MRVAVVAFIGQPHPGGGRHVACETATVLVGRNDSGKSFPWIRGGLTATFVGVHEDWALGAQTTLFAPPSLADQALFVTCQLEHFSDVFEGKVAYVLRWSLADLAVSVSSLCSGGSSPGGGSRG